jgi:hypothetical protein
VRAAPELVKALTDDASPSEDSGPYARVRSDLKAITERLLSEFCQEGLNETKLERLCGRINHSQALGQDYSSEIPESKEDRNQKAHGEKTHLCMAAG